MNKTNAVDVNIQAVFPPFKDASAAWAFPDTPKISPAIKKTKIRTFNKFTVTPVKSDWAFND